MLFVDAPHIGPQNSTPDARSNFFHLLVPAASEGERLCKVLFSAAALNYPTPRVLNWKKKFDGGQNDLFGGTHIAKISGFLDYLITLGPESDQEMVVLVDGYDMWFQLRPSVLIERYYRILNRQNARLRERLGSAVHKESIYQTIIAGAGYCWPQEHDHPSCYVVPDGELLRSTYAMERSQASGADDHIPRWVNSGSFMGPVFDVRNLVERAYQILKDQPNVGSDQWAFNEILPQQEYQREIFRAHHLSTF